MLSRRQALLATVGVLATVAAAVLWNVVGTVFFAITVAYAAEPVYRRLRDRGVPPWWASATTTVLVFLSALALFAPFAIVLYRRRREIVAFLRSFPESFVLSAGGFEYVLVTGEAWDLLAGWLRAAAVVVASASPVLGVKLTLFGIVLFALLIRKRQAEQALLRAVPRRYREIVLALGERARRTLLAIYVLQAVTAVVTFFVALAVFALLGYRVPIVLALLAGVLQFLPIVGPSVLVAVLVGYEIAIGDGQGALLVGLVGWIFVAWLPDVVVRPWLARRTARLPGSLYFVGFIGGVLTVGPVGIIAGPLVVALLQEAIYLLAVETDVPPETGAAGSE